MKNLKTKTALVFIMAIVGLTSFQSCESDKNEEIEPIENKTNSNLNKINIDENHLEVSRTIDNQKFEFKSTRNENIILSSFIVKTKNNKVIYETNYTLDLDIQDFKLYQSEKVINIAKDLDFSLDVKDYTEINTNFEMFFNFINSSLSDVKLKTLYSQLYFHKSILSIKLRSLLSNSNCECTLHPGYLVDKIGFSCQEDFYIPIDILNELVENKEQQFPNNEQAKLFKEHFQRQITVNQVEISFDKIYSFYGSKKDYLTSLENIKNGNQNRGCWFGQGSGHGCCGNYSGCCYYWNPLCWAHDEMCVNCSPSWFCLPGCVPD